MSVDQSQPDQGTCFVVMGFGKKTDFETGRVLDLDKSYKNLIKPAAEAAGLKCIRADEIVHSGMIDTPMYERLLNADVVVADLSTSNSNAFYELGIRHALRPFTTVVISEDGIKKFPFDVSHVAVRQYHHLGEDIGVDEARRFTEQLTAAIAEIIKQNPRSADSPIYTFLDGLTPPVIVQRQAVAMSEQAPVAAARAGAQTDDTERATHSALMEQVDRAQMRGDFITAKSLLMTVRQMMKPQPSAQGNVDLSVVQRDAVGEDPTIIQRLALVTYKAEYPNEKDALEEARKLLTLIAPQTTNDTETLGLWGAIHKRLWALTRDPQDLDVAINALARGFYLRHDHYNGINLAYMLNVRAANATDRAEAISDYVYAQRILRKVIEVCQRWLQSEAAPAGQTGSNGYLQEKTYWVKASIAEAYIGIGDDAHGSAALQDAFASAPAKWMRESTEKQIAKLRDLLSQSPLGYIRTD